MQTCLDKAQANNALFASQYSTFRTAQIERNFHNWTLLPNLSAYTGFNTSFGRRLDPFTNTFATTSVNSHSLGLNSSMVIFNGLNFVYKKNLLNMAIRKGEISTKSKQNEITIQIIELYVDLCKLVKQVEFAKIRIEKYEQIQAIQRLLIHGGKINEVDTLKSHNSLLNEQTLLIGLEMDIRIKTVDLNYLIDEPLTTRHIYALESVSQITIRPQFLENFTLEQLELDKDIAENQLKSDRSGILPNLALNGLLGTGFSTNNKDYVIAGNPTKSYRDQISQNLYEGIGLYLNIPIFNRGEWLKTKQLYNVKQSERTSAIAQTEMLLEKQKLELEQKRIKSRSEQELTKQISDNLRAIYDKTILLYSEGRTTYVELETAFMEWQTKLVVLENLKLDSELLSLYE
ncbi:TolC family protein [Fluviicola sp.]|uniref:TolC family protein n=1 Tax=Fluviicola sp. TaxID=1917219 RepID=UPI0028207EA3|nr:TolC family protein [Fluviicola sp.]MDR0803257.1 TolC family protein [Fluviicola sp.]